MDIFEFAMQMEKDGEAYYRSVSDSVGEKGIKTIMNMLADEEVRHYEVLSEMKTRTPKLPGTGILTNVRNIFAEMRNSGEKLNPKLGQAAMYRKAQELEKKSQVFYEEKSREVKLPEQKELFDKIAEEERRHYFILENIINFISQPDHWLENAEFNKLEAY
ncbi:MAG: ferritin family protein [Candidatus Glassbacteria bacterium]